MSKMTKSWAMTVVSFIMVIIMPLINGPLENAGIVISESELEHFLYVFLGVGTIGAGKAAHTKYVAAKAPKPATTAGPEIAKDANTQEPHAHTATTPGSTTPSSETPVIISTADVTFKPAGARYQTNFESDPTLGNVLTYGTRYLYGRINGARSYTSMILRDADKNVLDITQSNVDVQTCRIRMAAKDGTPLPRGTYAIEMRADAGSGDSVGIKDDVFEIV